MLCFENARLALHAAGLLITAEPPPTTHSVEACPPFLIHHQVPSSHTLRSPLPPAHQGRLHLMALHLITFLGGFTGLILGWSWMAEAQTARESGALPRSHVTQLYGTVSGGEGM